MIHIPRHGPVFCIQDNNSIHTTFLTLLVSVRISRSTRVFSSCLVPPRFLPCFFLISLTGWYLFSLYVKIRCPRRTHFRPLFHPTWVSVNSYDPLSYVLPLLVGRLDCLVEYVPDTHFTISSLKRDLKLLPLPSIVISDNWLFCGSKLNTKSSKTFTIHLVQSPLGLIVVSEGSSQPFHDVIRTTLYHSLIPLPLPQLYPNHSLTSITTTSLDVHVNLP